jgi:hypothetical protein
MKNKIFSLSLIAALGILLFSSCDKLKEAINADINLNPQDIEFTIPIISQTGATTISDVNFQMNIDSIIKANNVKLSANNIKSVKLKSCTLTLLDGDISNNFSALEAISIKFKSNLKTDYINIIDVTNNPDIEAQSLEIPMNTTIDLKDYFNATSFSYSIGGIARKTTSKTIQCKATLKYALNVGL